MSLGIAIVFLCTLIIGVPIAISLGFTSIVFMHFQDLSLQAFVHTLVLGMNSFPLMAVPFFILAGQLMNTGGITKRIFDFASCLVGPIPGGLGQISIVSSILFSGMSGAAIANAAGLGVVEIKAMKDRGYDIDFSVAVASASCVLGPIIPPSIIMVIYGASAGVSIGRLFIGGVIPGLLMALLLMAITYVIAKKRKYKAETRVPFATTVKTFIGAFPALMTPAIMLGGIFSGLFTPTEAGSVAVLYALILGLFVYKELKLTDLHRIFVESMKTTSFIVFIIGAARAFGWILTYFHVPTLVANYMVSITTSPVLIMLLSVILFLFLGCFMEAAAVVVMTVPVLVPLILYVGIDPVFYGIIIAICMSIGTLTPPFGMVMFLVCNIGGISLERFSLAISPYLIGLLLLTFILAFFPEIVMFLPNMLFN